MRRFAGLAASLFLSALSLAGCGHGNVITGGPLPTPSPTIPKVTNEFAVPTAGGTPGGIVSLSTGYLYFAEQGYSKIGQMTTGGSFKEYDLIAAGGTTGNNPVDLTFGPDGLLWFTEQGTLPGIASMTLSGQTTVTEYGIAGSAPTYIIKGPVPNTLVFSDPGNDAIGQITTSGAVTETKIPTANANPMGLALLASNGKVYFAEHDASKIGILDTATNSITEVSTPTANAGPTALAVSQDGAIWFTENNVAKIGRLDPTGSVAEYPLAPATSATGLVLGADNYFYFMDPAQNKIGRISLISPGTVTEYAVSTSGAFPVPPAFPGAMTLGPDSRVYFAEPLGNKIGQLSY